jgi:DNA-binding CsgD family transcriptional regulator/tetratricopeptide (TPR) repeat protein
MSRVVGRDAECAVLRRRLTAPPGAPGVIVLVAGEAGAGKTALVEHVLAATTTPALCGRAAEWAPRAYDVLARALRPVIGGASEPVPGILAQIIPELGAPPPGPDPAALAAAVCSVVTRVAGRRHAALFLDDLQWADEATFDLLPALADAGAGLPFTVIGCYRSDELPRGHRLRSIRALLRRNHQLTEVELGPLGDQDGTRMLAALLGAAPEPPLAAAVIARADGIPFAVEELALALRDDGHLTYHAGMVTLAGTGPAPVPDGIREAVQLRATRLTGAERTLVEAAAVAGNEFDIDTVLAASGVAAWPDGFTGSGLLADGADGRAAFRHPLTREAAYADIPWSRRRRLHRALASVLTADSAAPALIAAHLLAARDFGPARPALLAAAEQHCAVHAYRDAARALQTALDIWPSDEQDGTRLPIVDRLARCAEMCAEYADAVTLLRELADGHQRNGDNRALAATHRRLALVHELRGQWEPALAAREAAALAFSAAGQPAEAATDRLAVATHLRSAASYSAALATLGAVCEDAESAGRPDLLLRAQGLRGNVLSRLGRSREGIATVRAALDQALAESLPDTAAELQQRLADAIEHSGDYRAAKTAYATAYQYCDAHGTNDVGQLCRACATAVLFSCGEWDRAAGVCQDVLSSAGPPHVRAVSTGMLGLVHALRGAARLARPLLLESNLAATRIELTAMELFSSWGLCILDDAAGRHDSAADRAQRMLTRHARTQERHYSVAILQWLATFFTEHGLVTDALACTAVLSGIAEATGQPEAVAALAHARGETLLTDEPEAAARELSRAAEMFGHLGLPLETAHAQHRAAAAVLQVGEQARARELLHAAHATAGALGARQLRENCAAALSKLGGKPRQRASAHRAPAGLTGRELEVMLLVAQGNTSRQAGEALFISPRTVEMHVQASLLKLQCRTRAQAVRRLAELEALPEPDLAAHRDSRRQ